MKIVFEKLARATAVGAHYYLLRGHAVYCLGVDKDCHGSRLVSEGVRGAKITVLGLIPSLGAYLYEAQRLAFEHVEEVFERNFRSNPITERVIRLFDDPVAEMAFKKELTRELFQFYSINYIGSVLEQHFGPEEFYFVPSRIGWPHFFTGGDRYLRTRAWLDESRSFHFRTSKMRFPVWLTCWNYLTVVKEYGGWLFKNVALIGLLLCRYATAPRRCAEPRNSRYGITIINAAKQFGDGLQSVAFLVDGDKIKREDVVVVANGALDEDQRRVLRDRALHYVEAGGGAWDRAAVARALVFALHLLTHGWGHKEFILRTALLLLVHYCKWATFTKGIRIRHLVTHCDMGLETIARNILLKHDGTTTWYYMDSVNFACYFAEHEEDFPKYALQPHCGFLYYDYFVAWCDQVSTFFKWHHQKISRYVTLGCLWAEHTREIQEGTIPSKLREIIEGRLEERGRYKIVGVFDSTFVDGTLTPYRDGIAFLSCVLRLLDEMPELFVIFKEKKPRTFPLHPTEFVSMCQVLERHPRCHVTAVDANPSEVIALSDLIIAFPFTSVGFEALSLGRRVVYLDACGSLRRSYYDRAPGLVCRSYDQLAERTRDLLWRVSDEEYGRYLKQYIIGSIVANCDGRALTRFREMLVEAAAGGLE